MMTDSILQENGLAVFRKQRRRMGKRPPCLLALSTPSYDDSLVGDYYEEGIREEERRKDLLWEEYEPMASRRLGPKWRRSRPYGETYEHCEIASGYTAYLHRIFRIPHTKLAFGGVYEPRSKRNYVGCKKHPENSRETRLCCGRKQNVGVLGKNRRVQDIS